MNEYEQVVLAGNKSHIEQFQRIRMAHLYEEPFDFWRYFIDILDKAGYEIREKENVHTKQPEGVANVS